VEEILKGAGAWNVRRIIVVATYIVLQSTALFGFENTRGGAARLRQSKSIEL